MQRIVKNKIIVLLFCILPLISTAHQCYPTLTVSSGGVFTINYGDTVDVHELVLDNNAKIINNGVLRFVEHCGSSVVSDFNMIAIEGQKCFFTFYENWWNWKQNLYIENNGTIECKNFNQKFSNIHHMPSTYTFNNNGSIHCSENFYSDWTTSTKFKSSCNSRIEAKNITFQGTIGWVLNGTYITNAMNIDITQGGAMFNFGSDSCSESAIHIGKLTLLNNAQNFTTNGIIYIDTVELKTYNSVNGNISGIFIPGIVNTQAEWKKFTLLGNKNSIINLCYNPTDRSDDMGSSEGSVIYLESNTIDNAWNVGYSPRTDVDIRDIYGGNSRISDMTGNYKLAISPAKTREECLETDPTSFAGILPIELVYFNVCGNQFCLKFEWKVATENFGQSYFIEYSVDGINWRTIETIESCGSKSEVIQYQYCTRNDFPEGVIYFRLKLVTIEDVKSYSKVHTFQNNFKYDFKNLKLGPIDIQYNNFGVTRYIGR